MINLIKSKYQPIGQTPSNWTYDPKKYVNPGSVDTGASPVYKNANTDTYVGGNTGGKGTSQSDTGVVSGNGKTTTTTTTTTTTNTNTTAYTGKTFSRFTMDDMIQNQTELVTGGLWSTGLASLTTHFSSSTQTTTQRRYYVDVQNSLPGASDSLVQYSVAYGHAYGSGSDSVGQLSDSPSRAIYAQYRQLLLPPGQTLFKNGATDGFDMVHFYAITFKRNRMKERLDPGNFEIPMTGITTRGTNATGSFVSSSALRVLIDDSSINATPTVGAWGRVYNLVSGSISSGVYKTGGNPVYYGKVFPDYGVVIIDAASLDTALSFQTNVLSSSEGNNHFALFRAISASAYFTNAQGDKYGFLARNSEKITSAHYFVRIKNTEFNYTNNPSYVTGSQGDIKEIAFKKDPVTYITTVGLYNDDFELLAVAKVSKPILKSFSRESLIRVKLDF